MEQTVSRLTRRSLLQVVCTGSLLVPRPGVGQAAPPTAEAEAIVMDLAEAIWGVLAKTEITDAERVDGLVNVIGAKADAELIGLLVLGRYWRQLSNDQKRLYQERFPSFMLQILASRLNTYARDARGKLDDHFRLLRGQTSGQQDVLVRSKVLPDSGPTLAVDWRLRQRGDDLAIIDLIIEGVSLLVSQRSEFAAVIERRGIDELIDQIGSRPGS